MPDKLCQKLFLTVQCTPVLWMLCLWNSTFTEI